MRNRAGLVLGICVALLVLVAVVAAVLSTSRSGAQLPEGSPEATVQDYLRAVTDGDTRRAATHLDPEGRCTERDLRDAHAGDPTRVVLRDTRTEGEEADVRVDLVHGDGGPFGGDGYREELTLDLRREGGAWVVTGEPWPMYACSGSRP